MSTRTTPHPPRTTSIPKNESAWLIELFQPGFTYQEGDIGDIGNSLGIYYRDESTRPFDCVTTASIFQAKKFASKKEAEIVVDQLLSMTGVWVVTEHTFL